MFLECTSDCVAFCAVRSTPLPSGSNPVNFDDLTVNDGNSFNLTTSILTAPWSGLYWLHMSVGLEPGTTADVRLLGTEN